MIDLRQGADRVHNESTKSLAKFPSVKTDRGKYTVLVKETEWRNFFQA